MAKQTTLTWQNVVFTWDSLTKTRILRFQKYIDFDVVLGALWHQRSMQNRSKGDLGRPRRLRGPIATAFGEQFEAERFLKDFRVPCGRSKNAKTRLLRRGGRVDLACTGGRKARVFWTLAMFCLCIFLDCHTLVM